MDPPQEGDEDVNVMGGMVARLGLGEGGVVRPGAQAELMEQLGLGEGTRVVDLQVCYYSSSWLYWIKLIIRMIYLLE